MFGIVLKTSKQSNDKNLKTHFTKIKSIPYDANTIYKPRFGKGGEVVELARPTLSHKRGF